MFRRALLKGCYAVGGVVQLGCVIHVFAEYIAEPTLCIGPSMRPTINGQSSRNIVLTEHISNRLNLLERNDIVIARSPDNPNTLICKRITALEGDIVQKLNNTTEKIRVPKGHVWITGDNQEYSVDSRTYGPVPYGLILGRACFKLFPLSEFGPVR